MSQEQVDTFMAITSAESSDAAKQFIEMAGGNLETAISLFFEHGGSAQLTSHPNSDANVAGGGSDAELAETLQREAYQHGDSYRPPDQARHETLVDTHVFPATYGGIGGSFQPLRSTRAMFDDSRPRGIFNQQLDDYDDEDSEFSEEEQYNQQFEYVEENVMEIDDDGEVREYVKTVRKPKSITKEQKLAMLFRPPFDMMAKVNLDGAKVRARERKKWIMINIQTVDIFQCQALNRDLWSDKNIKKLVKDNFVFLQYQYDSHNAKPYIQFYGLNNKDELPHIAILDPMTGERLKQWNRIVPSVSDFIGEVQDFLNNFSLDPTAANPTVKEPTPEVDPSTLSEEQQLEIAIKQSLGQSPDKPLTLDESANESEPETNEDPYISLFNSIKPISHQEPENKPGISTRIQIRTGDGRRIVRRFDVLQDTVRTIYEVIKTEIEGYKDIRFTLSNHQRENLIEKLDENLSDAGLKNSSLLLERVDG